LASGQIRPGSARHFFQFWLPLLAYVALIFTLSAQPYLKPPLQFENSDKVMHLLEYGGLGILLLRVVRSSQPRRGLAAIAALAIGMALGALDEKFQAFIPGRDSSVFDWLADSVGVGLAQVLGLAWTDIWES